MTDTTLIFDGDILAYEVASKAEKATKWTNDIWTLHADEGEAKDTLDERIASLTQLLGGGPAVFAISAERSFRYDVYPQYKSNRKETRKPMVLAALKQHLLDQYKTYQKPGLEGDDILGILMTHPKIIPGPKMQISMDKDQRTIPGLLYNTKSGVTLEIDGEGADWYHLMQTLTGDTTDGYPGCPGIGPKKAEKILDCPRADWWPAVVAAFDKAGLSEEEALVQARCARILRHTDYDFKEGKVKLWQPLSPA